VILGLSGGLRKGPGIERRVVMTTFSRLSPQKVRDKVTSGEALLVCAYDNEDKFRKNHLDGAISLAAFKARLSSLSEDQEIIFYCA
jgi:hypothetical protein